MAGVPLLCDTSVWVDFLRGRRTRAVTRLDELLDDGLAVTEPIVMEVTMGGRDAAHVRQLHRLLRRAALVSVVPSDFDDAAAVYRVCRRAGATPRSPIDCLIAAVAVRAGMPVLHSDRDFDVIARHVDLVVEP